MRVRVLAGTVTPRQTALKLITQHGAEFDDYAERGLVGCVIAPAGVRFKATDCHTIALNYRTNRAEGWLGLLKDLRAGVEPCDARDCEICEEEP